MAPLYYNSNGFAFHRIDDAARILADLGYQGIALTPDVHHLDPYNVPDREVEDFRALCDSLGLGIVLETGARFVLDAHRKHRPSLLDKPNDARVRIGFLERCIELAQQLGAPVVTLWSGNGAMGVTEDVWRERLVDGLKRICDYAAERDVRIGFEPEPGMWIETTAQYAEIRDAVNHEALGLTLDVGHVLANREGDPAAQIEAHADELLVIQLDDHRAGVHDHLMFGEGEVDFDAIATAVASSGYDGPLEVELSRHSATAPATARASLAFLKARFGA